MTNPALASALATDERHELQLFEDEGEAVRWLQRP